MNHFVYAFMGREGMYQNVRLQIHKKRTSKVSIFLAYIISDWPLNKKKPINKCPKFLIYKFINYTSSVFKSILCCKQPPEVLHRKGVLKNSANPRENICSEASLSLSCWPLACNFVKKETPTQAF